jgi:replicative DNA helicase
MVNQSTEKLFYQYLRKKPELFSIIHSDFFQNKHIKACFEIDKSFYKKYYKVPTSEQMSEILQSRKSSEFHYQDESGKTEFEIRIFNNIFDIDINEYDSEWLKENFESWAEFKTLDSSVFEVISLLKTTNINSENVKDIVQNVKELILTKNNLSFDLDLGSNFKDANKHIPKKNICISTGYEWFDETLGGGFAPGELIVLAAAPKSGKSASLVNFAARGMMNGNNIAVVSMEMSERAYLKRLGCNLMYMTMEEYDKNACNTEKFQEKLNEFKKNSGMTLKIPGELYVKEFPTGTAGVPDIENYVMKLEESTGKKIQVLIIDYLNIMKNWRNPNAQELYLKIKQIAEDVRAMAQRLNVTVLSATQLNRNGSMMAKASITDISESMGLVHTVDALYSINKRDIMDADQSKLGYTALALRNSKIPDESVYYKVDFDRMIITEDAHIHNKSNEIDMESLFN